MTKVRLLLLILFFSYTFNAQKTYYLVGDQYGSSIISAENLLTVHKGIYSFQDNHLKNSYWKEDNLGKKTLGITYRLGKTVLLDSPLDQLFFLIQHEVFGHGYRYRNYEFEKSRYTINIGFPYGPGNGVAYSGAWERPLGQHEDILIRTGGMEANAVLGTKIREKWLRNGHIHYRESLLYGININNFPLYVWSTKLSKKEVSSGNDVAAFLSRINAYNGFPSIANYELTLDDLAKNTLINLLNPYNYFAAYTYLKTYLLDAEEEFPLPMISLGTTKWLPSIRASITPFGSEFLIENHFLNDKNLLELSWRQGVSPFDKFYGGGVKWNRRFKDLLNAQMAIDFWDQPAMSLGGTERFMTKEGFGGRLMTTLDYQFGKEIPVGVHLEMGYKSTGFIEGEILNKGLIFRFGLMFVEQ